MEYKNLTGSFHFSSINEAIKNIERDIDLSLYRVAITGPSRVGKSSLINSLLKKRVSPIGLFQTTGVPLQVIPGAVDKVTIYFHNSRELHFPFSFEKIEEYASQEFNENNKKEVRLISVSVRNQQLKRGVSLFDIPGLDDPSDDILNFTWQTIRKVNAVIYVIDASPMQDGGYIFRNDYKEHILQFSQSQDKIFLVFNKADRLTTDKLLQLKDRVKTDLIKHSLDAIIGEKVFYVSAEHGMANTDLDSVDHLNDKLWDFILGENKSGIVKLSLVNQELFKSTKSLVGILHARLLNNDSRNQLVSSIQAVKKKIPALMIDLTNPQTAVEQLLLHSLDNKKHNMLSALETKLKKVPLNEALPGSALIKKELIEELYTCIEQTNSAYVLQINQLKHYIDHWLEENLKQVRGILTDNNPSKRIDFTEIESFEAPQIDLSSAWGMGFVAMAAAVIFAPTYIFTFGLIGFVSDLFISHESRRAKQITKLVETATGKCNIQFSKLETGYLECFAAHVGYLNNYVFQKLDYYFADLEKEIAKLNKEINPAELKTYKESFAKIELLQDKLTDFDAELRSFHFTS